MKTRFPNRIAALVCIIGLVGACSSSTVIRSNPSGARVFLDGAYVGTTPYTLSDSKIVGSTTQIRLEYPGLPPTSVAVSRNEDLKVGTLIVGIFLLVPLLWVMGYDAEHTFELAPQQPVATY
jgi:PEGA domain